MSRIFVIMKDDIIDFPPILSLLHILNHLGYETIHMGTYSDEERKKDFEKRGIRFISLPQYDGKKGLLSKYHMQQSFRKKVKYYLKKEKVSKNDILWIPLIENIYLLHSIVYNYSVVLHPLEFFNPNVSWKYKVISPGINLKKSFRAAKAIVCCEYNRAQITKGLFSLDTLPFILPNKPYFDDSDLLQIPLSLKNEIEEIKKKIRNKKIILYQGIFLERERRLEEFCEAMKLLPDDFILIAMGRGGNMFDELRKKYESNRILFIPFIRPPYHLLITKEAYIGVLSYFPRPDNIGTVINPLYCAPNKVYEYSKFGKPMISNDIPGLFYLFQKYHCGECIEYPITPERVAQNILNIDHRYHTYKDGAKIFYDDIKMDKLIEEIINYVKKSN